MILLLTVIAVLVLLLLTFLFLGVHLSSRRQFGGDSERLAVFKDRKSEITADRTAGRISEQESELAIADLTQQLQHEAPDLLLPSNGQNSTGQGYKASWAWAVGLIAMGVAIGLGAYSWLGAPELTDASFRNSVQTADSTTPKPTLTQTIEELKKLSEEKPKDASVWGSLGKAHRMNGEAAAAVIAYTKAKSLGLNTPEFLVDFAESIAASNGGDFSGEPLAMLTEALRVSPDLPKGIALMGAAQYRLGNLKEAKTYLQKTLAALPQGSEQAKAVQAALDQVEGKNLKAPGGSVTEAPKLLLQGTLALDPSLKSQLNSISSSQASLFVALRASDRPMPLAAIKIDLAAVKDLLLKNEPIPFEIDESQLLSKPLTSSPSGYLVTVRISAAGVATKNSGDLQGVSVNFKELLPSPTAAKLAIAINQVVP
jgi:cytochrome c-type biogenesis protein CcmH